MKQLFFLASTKGKTDEELFTESQAALKNFDHKMAEAKKQVEQQHNEKEWQNDDI